jgi:hypothetical protein
MIRAQIQKVENGFMVIITKLDYFGDKGGRQPQESIYIYTTLDEVLAFIKAQA